VSVADMQAQYEFGKRIWQRVVDANSAVIAIRRVKAQVDDRLEQTDDDAVEAAADRLVDDASDVEGEIYQVKNRSNQDPLNFPIQVNNRLANLLSMLERGDGRPTDGMREVFGIMSDRLQTRLDDLEEIWATDLADLNRELERLGLDPVDPHDQDVRLVSQ
jgi:hypothetical protein